MKNLLNEQVNMTEAFNAGCFNAEKYPWFTVDSGKQPKKTTQGKLVVTGKNSKGDPVWFYEMNQGETTGVYQNRTTGASKRWSCDVAGIKSSQTSAANKTAQDKFITDFIADNQNYSNEDKSEYEQGVKYTKVDASTLPGANTIFKPGERFIFKRTGSANIKIEQQPKIESALNSVGYTLTQPAVTQPEYDQKIDIRNLMGGKYGQYYKILGGTGEPMWVWPMEGGTYKASKEDVKDILQRAKEGQLSKQDCRKSIKALDKLRRQNAQLPDEDLLKLTNTVWKCYKENKDFMSGKFGVEDELRNLLSDSSKYGIRKFVENERTQQQGMRESEVRLGKLIKEHLTLASIQKKKSILTEGEIIKSRLSILTEGDKPKTKKELGKLFDNLISETAYLHNQGFDEKIINEGFLDIIKGLFGNASTSIFSYFKEHLAKWLLERFFPSVDTNSWMGNLIITTIGNVPLTEIHNLTNCSYVSRILTKSIVESMANKVKNEQGLTGPGYDILRNATFEMIEDSSFGQKVEQKISDFICPKLQQITSKLGVMGDNMKSGALKSTGGLIPKISQ